MLRNHTADYTHVLGFWFLLATVITTMSGLVFVTGQQEIRLSADEVLVQMAEDAVADIEAGVSPTSVAGGRAVDIGQSLRPYLVVYDESGRSLASSARLNGATPSLPKGVTTFTKTFGEDRVTWLPTANQRHAVVVMSFDESRGGYVMAGRSLREVEHRIYVLLLQVGLVWSGSLIIALIVSLIVGLTWKPTPAKAAAKHKK